MTVADLLAKHGIKLPSTAPGRHYTQCPQCSHERRKSSAKPLGVTIEDDGGVHWGCNHCSWTGPEKGAGKVGNGHGGEGFAATYDYTDADGALLFQKVRNAPGREPRFWLRRPDGNGGWINGTKGVNTGILYHAPGVARAITEGRVVAVVEGEKDANSVRALGIIATCNAHGASELGKRPKWTRAHSEQLRGADIVVLNDHDGAGYAHADAICNLSLGVAKRVRRLDLAKYWSAIPKGGDVSDWLAAGHTGEELAVLIEQAPDYAPPPGAKEQAPPAGGSGNDTDDAAELEKLARFAPLDYERARKDAGKRLGISRLALLDALVKAKRAELGLDEGDGKAGHAIEFPTPDPWLQPVDGAALLDALSSAIGSYVIMERRFCDTAALWIVHSYMLDHFQVTPRLAIRLPVKRCGKSTLLDVFRCLVLKALPTSSVTASVTFRVIEKHQPCLLIDEADMLLRSKDESKDLYSVLLDGHRRGGQTLRNVGDEHEPRGFNTYAAIAIASIGKLIDTLTDRSIVIDLKRRKRNEQVARFRFDRVDHLTKLARQIMRWVTDHGDRVAAIEPDMPDSVFNRDADNWRPLLMVADAAGGQWPERARKAALTACGAEDDDDEEGYLELLLRDIRDIIGRLKEQNEVLDRISSDLLIDLLCDLDEPRPWPEYGKSGKPITPNKLARLLKPAAVIAERVAVQQQQDDGRTAKVRVRGYKFSSFQEPFERYLPPIAVSKVSKCPEADEQGTSELFQSVPNPLPGHFEKCGKPNNDGRLDTWTLSEGESGQSAHAEGSNGQGVTGGAALCTYCGRPGGNRVALGGDAEVCLHRACEAPFIDRRMREEGIAP
jgi:putative DNA primase/helicase